MDPEKRKELIEQTREEALLFVEDLEHLKSVSEKTKTSPVDLRHASAILRRWLVEDLLKRIAGPRIGKLLVISVNNNPIYQSMRKKPANIFVSGGASVHGIQLAAVVRQEGNVTFDFRDYSPDKTIELNIDSFKKQKVIFSDGEWITRHQVIKFVANVGSGVHAGKINETWEKILGDFRGQISIRLEQIEGGENQPTITWAVGAPGAKITPGKYDPTMINGVLLEIISTVHFLINSPDMERLKEAVVSE